MSQTVQFQILPEQVQDLAFLKHKIKEELGLNSDDFQFVWKKRSIDARKRIIKINCSFEVYLKDESIEKIASFNPKDVSNEQSVAIIGAGPAGLFAALHCLEVGLKPIVFERGKDVRSRRRDLAKLNKDSIVNPESNYWLFY